MSNHELMREALCLLIRGGPGLRIVGEAKLDPAGLLCPGSSDPGIARSAIAWYLIPPYPASRDARV